MAKKIRPARAYQRKDDPTIGIVRRYRPQMKRDLRAAIGHLSSSVPVLRVARLIREGKHKQIIGAIDFKHYREILKTPFNRLATIHTEAAKHGARKINAAFVAARRKIRFRKAMEDRFNFDVLNPEVQAALREQQDNLIQQLENDARDTIESVIVDGVSNGLSADEMAANIRDMISLTDTQAQAVMNFQQMLSDLDPEALTRQLRNTDYDQIVQDAIDSGTDLADAAIQSMVDDYISNYMDYRADTIARTESMRAANDGLHDAYSQAIERGALPSEAVRREWQLGDHPCEICESIPDMNEDGVGVDEDFDSIDGPVDDPPVHPSCMCSVAYITDLSQVPDDTEDDSGQYDTAATDQEMGL